MGPIITRQEHIGHVLLKLQGQGFPNGDVYNTDLCYCSVMSDVVWELEFWCMFCTFVIVVFYAASCYIERVI